jgi:hypothetical protein
MYAVLLIVGCHDNLWAQPKLTGSLETLDARTWDFSKRLPLKGQWSVVENKLVSPQDILKENWRYSTFPSLWNETRADRKGSGCATYGLNIILRDTTVQMALEIPPMYSSYNVWVNGQLISTAGVVACEIDKATPQWIYHAIPFTIKDTVQVVLQVANFHHHKGGAVDPVYLGTLKTINSHFNWSIGSSLFEASILFLEGIFFLFFYRRDKKAVILYFALLCLSWSIRSVFSNVYPLMLVYPDFSWQWLVKIEYLTLYLTVIWAALFFNTLFGEFGNKIFTYLPVALNVFFILFTLLTPATIFTRWVSVYLIVAALVITYGVALIVRALINDQKGSWFLMSSIWVGVLIFGYDIVAYQSSFSHNIVLLNIGYVTIFILTTIALLYHVGVFKSKAVEKNVLTMNDLYGPNRKV